ncbi:MAG: methionyl-tRNA formyltransferase [Desulfurivibrionaceae bacterium]|nr:methionyl-tRNA formyltransferase [Desulfurivibrionaceae bacterium]
MNRIIFMGTPDFAVPSLQAMLDHGEKVVAVVCQPDRPKGRGCKVQPPPVKVLATRHGIPVLQPLKVRSQEWLAELAAFEADLFVVTAYGRLLPGPLLNLPPLGTINVHGSLLPRYRGAAPVQRAILAGEAETGITIMQMDEGMDTGDILLTGRQAIGPDDTTSTLAVKMASLGGELLVQALELQRRNQLPPRQQDEALATDAPMLSKDEAPIDWHRSATQISCQIRGLDPWPKAHTHLGDKWLRPFRPQVLTGTVQEAPGTLIKVAKDGLVIATGQDSLLVREIQLEGKKKMSVDAFLRGHPLEPGLLFT